MTKAKGAIRDFYHNQVKGEAFLSLTLTDYDPQGIVELKDKVLDIELKQHRKKRSLDANATCWLICTEIAKATGISKEDIYRENIRQGNEYTALELLQEAIEPFRKMWGAGKIGWFVDEMDYAGDGKKLVFAYHGSSEYDSKQMHSLIDRLLQDAENCEVRIDLTPESVKALIADWEVRHEKRNPRGL